MIIVFLYLDNMEYSKAEQNQKQVFYFYMLSLSLYFQSRNLSTANSLQYFITTNNKSSIILSILTICQTNHSETTIIRSYYQKILKDGNLMKLSKYILTEKSIFFLP